jgi:hypothetical protein
LQSLPPTLFSRIPSLVIFRYLSLAIGSPLSELATAASKITAINAKHGPFDACVLVGDIFKPESDGSEVAGISCTLDLP